MWRSVIVCACVLVSQEVWWRGEETDVDANVHPGWLSVALSHDSCSARRAELQLVSLWSGRMFGM
jgi:hypothetical protein